MVRKADYGGASLCLSLPSGQFRQGETLSGTLSIRLNPGVKYKGMRLQLERKEQSGETQFEKVEDRAVLTTPSTSPADGTLEGNFQLQVPQYKLLPSTAPGVTSVSWSIRGMLIRRGILYTLRILRPDYMQVEQVIQVYTA